MLCCQDLKMATAQEKGLEVAEQEVNRFSLQEPPIEKTRSPKLVRHLSEFNFVFRLGIMIISDAHQS
jgi:hypothetical protein